jgi:MATE family multidrug resistance protein
MNASTWVLLIVAPINALNNYLLVWYEPISLGFIGAPIATSFTYWLQLILLLLYIKFVRGHEAWGGWSMEAFKDWWPFIQLAIPGIFMVCSEWWSWVSCDE